jgi:hypothetical protein
VWVEVNGGEVCVDVVMDVAGVVVGDVIVVCGGICDVGDSGEHGEVFCVVSFVGWMWPKGGA